MEILTAIALVLAGGVTGFVLGYAVGTGNAP